MELEPWSIISSLFLNKHLQVCKVVFVQKPHESTIMTLKQKDTFKMKSTLTFVHLCFKRRTGQLHYKKKLLQNFFSLINLQFPNTPEIKYHKKIVSFWMVVGYKRHPDYSITAYYVNIFKQRAPTWIINQNF